MANGSSRTRRATDGGRYSRISCFTAVKARRSKCVSSPKSRSARSSGAAASRTSRSTAMQISLTASTGRRAGRCLSPPALEPLRRLGQPRLERDARFPPELRARCRRVDRAAPLLAGLARAVADGAGKAACLGQQPGQLVHGSLATRPDVERSADARFERVAVDARHVLDVQVVARLLAVAIDHRVLSSEHPLQEDGYTAGTADRARSRPLHAA